MLRTIKLLVFVLLPAILFAQSNLDFLRNTGKIYSVVAVICVIFLGIVLYLLRLDKKIKNLEEKFNNES